MTRPEPLFVHDCPECVFLGHFVSIEGYVGDGYACPRTGSIVWRVSDEGWEYHSLQASSIARWPDDDPYVLKAVWKEAARLTLLT